MNTPTSHQVLKLYRHLIRYGKQLKYTDKEYYLSRVREEFQQNKNLEKSEEIIFNYKVYFF